jgi:hypothetical protein
VRPARIRLFPVGPLVPVPRLTEEQCGLVDEIEGLGGEPLRARGKNFNRLLRRLMGLGCVQWVGAGGRYRVTKLGAGCEEFGGSACVGGEGG